MATFIDRSSFDGGSIGDIIAEFPNGDEMPGQMIPVKKLSDAFDSCAKGEGHMKVYLRIRPLPSKCLTESTIVVESDCTIVTNAPESSKRAQYTKLEERKYAFTRVFAPFSLQADVYTHTVSPLLDRFLQGENCVLFAYGMTNSGKTHTIQGTDLEPGLLPRLVAEILESIHKGRNDDHELLASMLEIYQEKIFDLLGKKAEKLTIRDGNGKVEVNKLSEHHITSISDATKLMDTAGTKRSKSTTLLNTGSSRSHAVYTLTLKGKSTGKDVVFHVVDLAGAERSNRTKATAQQQKEANNINTSLMQLWRCLQGMKRKSSEGLNVNVTDIIPFRESKLTHLLMPQLCRAGLSGVAMIACVNPQGDDYDETLSILGNASLASKIRDITELRRPVIALQTSSSSSNDDQATIASVAAAAINAATALGKRRRVGYNSLTHVEVATEKRSSKRFISASTSTSTSNNLSLSGNIIGSSSTAPAIADEKSKRPLSQRGNKFAVSKTIIENTSRKEIDFEVDGDKSSGSVIKRMKIEISRLQEENDELLNDQFTRETEIRIEVSLEMAKCSAHLLDQIQDLQTQLDGKESIVEDITRSCKKMRKEQLQKANEDMAKDLEEAEEELERMKAFYEEQMFDIKEEKKLLEMELAELKKKITSTRETSASNSNPISRNSMNRVSHVHKNISTNSRLSTANLVFVENNLVSNADKKINAGVEFSKRMSRDHRFKNSENEKKIMIGKKITDENDFGSKLALIRSPLGPVRNDPNSPMQEKNSSEAWEESPKGSTISPLRYDNSMEMYKHKENVHEQLQKSPLFEKMKAASVDVEKDSNNQSASHVVKAQNQFFAEMKLPPKTRATVVSARRVISTRITHQAPDILAAYEAAHCGANPNAGNYINRLRTRTVR